MFFRLYLTPGSGRLWQPATIDPTSDLCTRYPLRLGGLRQCGIRSLPDTSTHGQHWEIPSGNPTPNLLILSPTPYPLGHMLHVWVNILILSPLRVSFVNKCIFINQVLTVVLCERSIWLSTIPFK